MKITFSYLKKMPYKTYRQRRRFKKLALIYERSLKYHRKRTEPLYSILKNKNVHILRKYMYCNNTKKSFTIKSYKFRKLKKGINILPVHIHNAVHNGKTHLNIFIIDTRTKKVTRLDPSYQKYTKILTHNVHKSCRRFFKKIGYTFTGFSKKNRFIRHGGLCRFSTPGLYIYGKRLNHPILKKMVLDYLSKLRKRKKNN